MSFPWLRVPPSQAATLTRWDIGRSLVITCLGLPLIGVLGKYLLLALDVPLTTASEGYGAVYFILVCLQVSVLVSWVFAIAAIPLVRIAVRRGFIGWSVAIAAGWGVGLLVTLVLLFVASDEFNGSVSIAFVTSLFGALFGLVFWLILRALSPSSFARTAASSSTVGVENVTDPPNGADEHRL